MSCLSLDLHPEAIAEARAAWQWYRSQSPAAAKAFLAELDAAMECLCSRPELYPTYLHGTRCYLLRRFPYRIVYRAARDRVHIYAIAHSRRRPGYWKGR